MESQNKMVHDNHDGRIIKVEQEAREEFAELWNKKMTKPKFDSSVTAIGLLGLDEKEVITTRFVLFHTSESDSAKIPFCLF